MKSLSKKEIEDVFKNQKNNIWGTITCKNGCYYPNHILTSHNKWKPYSHQHKLYTNQLIQTLDMFNTFADTNNILYSLHAGSLVGFYWSGKIIPFDDDIDVIVSRDSYKTIKKYFWDDAETRESYKIKRTYNKIRWDNSAEVRVREVNGVLYECVFKNVKAKAILKLVPIDAVTREYIGGMDITVCDLVNGKKIDRWSFKKYNECTGPTETSDPADFPEVEFNGIKTRAVVRRLGYDMLTKMYGEQWIIPCHYTLDKYFIN